MTLPAERAGLLLRAAFMRSHIKGSLGSKMGPIVKALRRRYAKSEQEQTLVQG